MTDADVPLGAGSDLDDLPRTLRREHEARARKARERERSKDTLRADAPDIYTRGDAPAASHIADDAVPAAVTRIDMPFVQLVLFFLKAVVAAIPALILLTVILWFMGKGLQIFFPELLQMKILITFPN